MADTDTYAHKRIDQLQREINDLRSDYHKLFDMMESMAKGAVDREDRLQALELRAMYTKI